MKRLMAVALVLVLWACGGHRPPNPPPPPPTPPPPVVMFPDLLLRQDGGHLTRNGQPFQMFGAIPCWDPTEQDHFGWSGFTQEWINYTKPFGANAYHIRLGPYPHDDTWPNGLAYQHGTYLNDDPAQGFDPVFWDRAVQMCVNAGKAGANCEVTAGWDGWACKHRVWGDFDAPISLEEAQACTNHQTPLQQAFTRHAVEKFGPLANVIWIDSNEPGVSGWYDPKWSLDMVQMVRQYEQEVGLGVVHMFGTNSGNADVECDPRIDYTATHSNVGIDGPVCGKFRENNEHNPPFTPETERALFCSAKSTGQAWWYWRGGQTQPDMDATLHLFAEPCGDITGECPFDVPVVDSIKVKCGPADNVDECDSTPLVKGAAYCRSIGYTDGRLVCPVRVEGDPFRLQCELRSMGGLHEFKLTNVQGSINISKVKGNGFKIELSGSGSAEVQVFAPDRPGEDLAINGQGGKPVSVSRQ